MAESLVGRGGLGEQVAGAVDVDVDVDVDVGAAWDPERRACQQRGLRVDV